MNLNLKDLTREVLEKGYLMTLAVSDEHGAWAADVIYVFDDEMNLYWMSDPDTRHSTAITTDSQVAGTITVSNRGEGNLGLQFSGVAEKIDGARYDLATKHFAKRNKPLPKETDDVLDGDSWYVLKITKLFLIHEKYFGFKRQEVRR